MYKTLLFSILLLLQVNTHANNTSNLFNITKEKLVQTLSNIQSETHKQLGFTTSTELFMFLLKNKLYLQKYGYTIINSLKDSLYQAERYIALSEKNTACADKYKNKIYKIISIITKYENEIYKHISSFINLEQNNYKPFSESTITKEDEKNTKLFIETSKGFSLIMKQMKKISAALNHFFHGNASETIEKIINHNIAALFTQQELKSFTKNLETFYNSSAGKKLLEVLPSIYKKTIQKNNLFNINAIILFTLDNIIDLIE